jgi:hypothetical protein
MYSFPDAKLVAALTPEDLMPCDAAIGRHI